jgi:acyl carrier protein
MLPEAALTFLSNAASEAGVGMPGPDASLFGSGLLDSFSLVDFVTVIEAECRIRIDDDQLIPENFDTIARIEAFVERLRSSARVEPQGIE